LLCIALFSKIGAAENVIELGILNFLDTKRPKSVVSLNKSREVLVYRQQHLTNISSIHEFQLICFRCCKASTTQHRWGNFKFSSRRNVFKQI